MQVNNTPLNVAKLYSATPAIPANNDANVAAAPKTANTTDTVTLSATALAMQAADTTPGSGWGNEPPVRTLNTAQANTAPGSGWGNEPPVRTISAAQADAAPGSGWGNEPPIKV